MNWSKQKILIKRDFKKLNGATGFLLGAGASFELGMPLADELTIEFKRALLKTKSMPYYKVPPKFESILLQLLHDNHLIYEDIIGRIEVEIQRNRSKPLYHKWHGLLSRYLEAIFYLLLERHSRNKTYIESRLELFSPLTKFCDNGPLWIFSLNHDLLIEIIAKHINIPVKSGFHDTVKINNFIFERLTRENMNNNHFSFYQNGKNINLIKLHGSLDVFVQGDEKNYLKLVNKNNNSLGIIDDISKLVNCDATRENGIKCTNEITYYDRNHILQFLRMTIMSGKYKYSSRVSHNMDDWFFKIFNGHINYTGNLYCIGYSFQDLHVNAVIYEWLSFSSERKMVILNPSIKEIPFAFKHIKNQIEIINLGFLEFLNEGSSRKTLALIKGNQKLREISRKTLRALPIN